MAGETDRSLGQIVAAARKQKGWSLRELAGRVTGEGGRPIAPQYLNDIEHGRRIPSDRVIDALAKALDVSPDRLFLQARRLPPDLSVEGLPAQRVEKAYQAFRRALKDR